jgi:hypothetical protein
MLNYFQPEVRFGSPGGPEIRLPLFPRKRTQVGHPAMSVWCLNGLMRRSK